MLFKKRRTNKVARDLKIALAILEDVTQTIVSSGVLPKGKTADEVLEKIAKLSKKVRESKTIFGTSRTISARIARFLQLVAGVVRSTKDAAHSGVVPAHAPLTTEHAAAAHAPLDREYANMHRLIEAVKS